ncbi:hypothetical protein F0562_031731 [Nyssa sinensis]|uniref:CS domain-containing protein n=1 Tax=Nyssa sinensis TaxID=561372 RepID=A0A5J5AW31_9ASTE|nr:hypothetical protein F0562_031731 [Nyssa sinensis]
MAVRRFSNGIKRSKRSTSISLSLPTSPRSSSIARFSLNTSKLASKHDLTCPVKTDSSFWTIEDDTMHITLQKRDKGQTWSSPILGQGQLDPYAVDLEQKRLMLQRFQEENPGFDFSQAQFSGNCPDPRTFMGGIRSD